ncbi:unnamed protein product [Auanema sp. JU1783]|nr:unnamed protein product [Auanema sp. JU1783]
MFLPVDQEVTLRLPVPEGYPEARPVVSIASNREKTFVAVATEDSIYIWLAHPHLLLCILRLSESDILERGTLNHVYWRCDSSAIAITTSRNHILIYQVDVSTDNCYNVPRSSTHPHHTSKNLFLQSSIPIISLYPSVVINLAATATCCVPLREELLVCIRNGFCHHIGWDGSVHTDFSIRLASIPFAHDQLQSKPEYISDPLVHAIEAVYAPLVGGYCMVLSDGRGALLTSSDSTFHPNSILGVWALSLKDAVCADVNHKFRSLVFGCMNGDIAAYHLDDANGSLVQTFRVSLLVTNGPEITNRLGQVARIQVLSSGCAIAAVWSDKTNDQPESEKKDDEKSLPPTLAIFTPYGSQTWCSLESVIEWDSALSSHYTTLAWGPEGFSLWLGRNNGLFTMFLARLAALSNPLMEHSERVMMMTGSKVMVSPPREREECASAPHSVWTTYTVPSEYISVNWPLRFATYDDKEPNILVVAGTRGLAYCNISLGRWKIFGNESQERDIIVTGGVFVWNGTVAAACYDSHLEKELLKFYPLSLKLDNQFASCTETESRILMLSVRESTLVTFDVDGRIFLFQMKKNDVSNTDDVGKVFLEKLAEIRVFDLITHPACLVSIQLTQLNLESGGSFCPGVDTVLVNVSGRLITLNPKNASKEEDEIFQLQQPIIIASFVEQVWHDRACKYYADDEQDHLGNALWINCGTKGMKVWLPLFPSKNSQTVQGTSFISRRIMLPIELDICPAVIFAKDCLAVGVESVLLQVNLGSDRDIRTYNLARNSEVFVHHLLRQLLKRNLGVFALEVAGACRSLPHFSHSLELLLHGVLEEEATSSEPIPDPFLPRCVAFIQEFPEFLKTVAHCTRKTELAFWSSLFEVTGSPNDLFEVCLRDGQLKTAASYLIVLQNLENAQISLEQAARLLREALSAGEWTTASDMVRFARSIDAEDMDNFSRTPPQQKTSSRRPTASISLNAGETNDLVFSRFQAVARVNKVRHSQEHKESSRKDSSGSSKKVGRALSNDTSPPSPISMSNPMAEKMNQILDEHAQHLLDEYCIRDFGYLCAHLDLDVKKLMAHRSILDFPVALTRIHSQFAWSYPVPGKHFVDHLEKKFGSMKVSRSTACLTAQNDEKTQPKVLTGEEARVPLPSSTDTDMAETASVEIANLLPVDRAKVDGNAVGRPGSPESSVTQALDTPDGRSCAGDYQGIEVLLGDSNNRGPSESQLQMNYMIQLFSEASAIDWVFLLCLICRDITRLRSEISTSSISKWGVEAFGQTRLGATILLEWATVNCIGYVSVLQLFKAHLDIIAEQVGCLNLPPRRAQVKTAPNTNGLKSNGVLKHEERMARPSRLQESFRPRERSRSVDRGRDNTVSDVEEGEGCTIM